MIMTPKTQSTNSSIRVLFYEPYPMGLGGNFLTQCFILERLDRTRFTSIVAAPKDGVALDEFRKMGVECVVVPPPKTIGSYGGAVLRVGVWGGLKAVFGLLQYNLKLSRVLRDKRIDVVYANCVRAEMSIGLAARLAGVPSLLYIKGELDNPLIDRLSFMLASKILFFCEQNRDDKYPNLIRSCSKKIDILKIGMDLSVIKDIERRDKSALRDELGIDPTFTNVIVLAQLYRPKGQHFVIEALSRLVKDFPNIRLYLLGDHVIDEYRSYKEELDRLIAQKGLGDHVKFTGWRRDALEVASMMDILIHPSLAEGFGRAVLEAMALGLPVIASRVGGLREAVKDGLNGFLVEPGDVDAIEKRWRQLIVSSELRVQLGQAARETVFDEYQIDDKIVRLAEIWAEMAHGKA